MLENPKEIVGLMAGLSIGLLLAAIVSWMYSRSMTELKSYAAANPKEVFEQTVFESFEQIDRYCKNFLKIGRFLLKLSLALGITSVVLTPFVI